MCHSESPVANMRNSDVLFGLCFMLSFLSVISSDSPNAFVTQDTPSVMVALLVRNKAHVLPWSLHYIQHLEYQKDRMSLWIRSDHNQDKSTDIVKAWLGHVEALYHSVDFHSADSPHKFADEKGPHDWSEERFRNMIRLRQEALDAAREMRADYLLFVDADNFLTNPHVLQDLIDEKKTIVAPMLNVTASSHYSNFWCGMDDQGYYERTPDYLPILGREKLGCFPVAMVHSTLLIHISSTSSLAYSPPPPEYKGPIDDIIIFAHSARHHGIAMHLLNRDFYGFMLMPVTQQEDWDSHVDDYEQFVHLKIENIIYDTPLEKLDYIDVPVRPADKLGFDQVYMINLERRPDRRNKMVKCFKELGIEAKIVNAVDGQKLNDTYLQSLGVKMLPGYEDPYHKRPLTKGEIGCFLSHYFIWQDVVRHNYPQVVIFEDDIRFELYFRQKLEFLMQETRILSLDWDLIYLGRKKLNHRDEAWVAGTETLVWPEYSYWTLSYLLTGSGAHKLLVQEPLSRMIPVDEYLPVMFNRHPQSKLKAAFRPRDVIGMSAEPLLVYPTHYTGEPGYITDTDESEVINPGTSKEEL